MRARLLLLFHFPSWTEMSALAPLFAIALVILVPSGAWAQLSNAIYVSDLNGGVFAYNATTGAQITTFEVTGLGVTRGLALSGNTLFVADRGNKRIGSYNATTGAAINASLISTAGLGGLENLTILGNNLFVSNQNTVGKYLLDGTPVNTTFLTGFEDEYGLAAIQNTLYVADVGANQVRAFNATTGGAPPTGPATITAGNAPVGVAATNSALYVANADSNTVTAYSSSTGAPLSGFATPSGAITMDINRPLDVALQGNTLYVSNRRTSMSGYISTYNATTGAQINNALISTNFASDVILVTPAAMPEPASLALLALGAPPLVGVVTRQRRRSTIGR